MAASHRTAILSAGAAVAAWATGLLTDPERNAEAIEVMRQVDTNDLARALKGVSDIVKNKILKNMSRRASEMLSEDMDAMGPVRVSEVEEAQQAICAVAVQLGGELGEFVHGAEGDVGRLELLPSVAKAAGLFGAAWGFIFRIEIQHHSLLASVV